MTDMARCEYAAALAQFFAASVELLRVCREQERGDVFSAASFAYSVVDDAVQSEGEVEV